MPLSHCFKAAWSISEEDKEDVQRAFGITDASEPGAPAPSQNNGLAPTLVLANAPGPKIHNKSYASLDSNPSFVNLDCLEMPSKESQEKQVFFVAGDESRLKTNVLTEIRKIFQANVR